MFIDAGTIQVRTSVQQVMKVAQESLEQFPAERIVFEKKISLFAINGTQCSEKARI